MTVKIKVNVMHTAGGLLAIDNGRGIKFAAGNTLRELKASNITGALTLRDAVKTERPIFIRLNERISRRQVKLLLDYYEQGGDLSRVYFFAETPYGEWAFIRSCTGHTLQVLVQAVAWYFPDLDVEPLIQAAGKPHPAAPAAEFLYRNGGYRESILHVIRTLGDLRHAVAAIGDHYHDCELVINRLHMYTHLPSASTHPPRSFIEAYKNYVLCMEGKRSFDPVTFEDHLVLAVLGLPRRRFVKGRYGSDIVLAYPVKDRPNTGMSGAMFAGLQLIICSWLSNEFHTDMFEFRPFWQCGESASVPQYLLYKQIHREFYG